MKILKFLAILVLVVVLVGCAHTPGGVAPSNIPIGEREYVVMGRARGTDSCVYLFGFIPLKGSNSVQCALDSALRNSRADALIQVTSESVSTYWIIFTKSTIIVNGTAIRFKQ